MKLLRFSSLIRKALRFRAKLEGVKRSLAATDFPWYPYDCFANMFYVEQLLRAAGLSLETLVAGEPVLDIGAADGAISLFLESLGYSVHAWDHQKTNINGMRGIRSLVNALESRVEIADVDMDGRFAMPRNFGLVFLLGTLYHLKNPFYALETLSSHSRFCFLSTRVARVSANDAVRLEDVPVAYLLDETECNSDETNYWIFSPKGLELLVRRAGWQVLASATSGAKDSTPSSPDRDERMFLLLRSKHDVATAGL